MSGDSKTDSPDPLLTWGSNLQHMVFLKLVQVGVDALLDAVLLRRQSGLVN